MKKNRIGKRMKNLKKVVTVLAVIICAGASFSVKGSMAEAVEKEAESFPVTVTWDDFQNMKKAEPTMLHFRLSGGNVVDIELPWYPSVVEQVYYRDIIGDGKEEVLVYRYFANTATEYTLIDIFEITDKTVRNLSPGMELEELNSNVWDMTLMEDSTQEEGCPVFRLESYDKKYGMTFRDETVLIGYRDGGWRIFGRVSWKVEQAVEMVKEYVRYKI